MSVKKQTSTIFLVAFAVVTLGTWASKLVDARSPDHYYSVKKNLNVFGKVYRELSNRYVEAAARAQIPGAKEPPPQA